MQRCLLLTGLLVLFGCGEDSSSGDGGPALNVLLISVDTLRNDHLGCYGYPRATSPTIDRLAQRGTVFDHVFSTSSWTLPAHGSLLTGVYPVVHGLRDDGNMLQDEMRTLADVLRDRGRDTLAVVSHVYVSRAFGFQKGFDVFDDSLTNGGRRNPIASEVVDRALQRFDEVVDGEARRPFFAFVHFFDPHWDYTAPAPFGTRFVDPAYDGPMDGTFRTMTPFVDADQPMADADRQHLIDLYDGEIAYLDEQLGRLFAGLEERGLMNDTVVVLTGDHGEEFKEHGRLGHAKTLFGEQLGVPLVIAGGDFVGGGRRSEPASLVDVAPTLVDLVGGAPEVVGSFNGKSLRQRVAPGRPVFADSIRRGVELRSARIGSFKVVQEVAGDQRTFFDLTRDPGELSPLDRDPTGGELSAALEGYAQVADHGWRLKLVSLDDEPRRFFGRITTTATIYEAQPLFSDRMMGRIGRIKRFELAEDGKTLFFNVLLHRLAGEIAFQVEPPDAAVTVNLHVASEAGQTRSPLFLGEACVPVDDEGAPVTLQADDPRLVGVTERADLAPGGYVRATIAADRVAPESDLSAEAIEALQELGYVGSGGSRQGK